MQILVDWPGFLCLSLSKKFATLIRVKLSLTTLRLLRSHGFNRNHFDTCTADGVILKQKLFQHSGDPWEGDNITLKADLIRTSQCWQELTGKESRCPLQYSSAEVDECFRLEAEQKLGDEDMEKSRNCLGVSVDGWVPWDRYDAAKALSESFKAEAIASADSEDTVEQIRKHWPFDDHDENE